MTAETSNVVMPMFAYMILEPIARFSIQGVQFRIHENHMPGIKSGDFDLYAEIGDWECCVGEFGSTATARRYAKENVGVIKRKIEQHAATEAVELH